MAIVLSGVANSLAKWTSGRRGRDHLIALALTAGCYGVGLSAYAIALMTLPLAVAYPILVGGGMAFVLLFATFGFGERLSPKQCVGIVCIVAGMLTITA